MNVISIRHAAALRLMLSIEKTTRSAEIIRQGHLLETREVDIAVQVGTLIDGYARAALALEEATAGKIDPEAQIRIHLHPETKAQLRSIVLAGAYTAVNPDAADAEGRDLIASLMGARQPLLNALSSGEEAYGFPIHVTGPVVLH